MDVRAGAEGLHHGGIPAHVGQQPQLDLGIVRPHQHPARAGHKGPADLPAQLRAHGDILQIGLRAGDAAGGGNVLVEAGMHPAVRLHQGQQPVQEGALQLGEEPVFHHHGHDGMVVL